MNNMMQMMQSFNNFKQNPAQMLLSSGKITRDQYQAMQGMTPSQMGQYLMDSGVIKNDQLNELQQMAQQFRGLFT